MSSYLCRRPINVIVTEGNQRDTESNVFITKVDSTRSGPKLAHDFDYHDQKVLDMDKRRHNIEQGINKAS